MARKPYIGKWISVLYRIGHSFFFDEFFEKYGIGSGHFGYLMNLYREEGVSQDTLSRNLNVDKATTTRAVMKLESLGYIQRIPDPDDKRAYRVYLTERGRDIEPYVRKVLKNWAELITEGFNDEEKKIAYALLKRMAENAILLKEQKLTISKTDKS